MKNSFIVIMCNLGVIFLICPVWACLNNTRIWRVYLYPNLAIKKPLLPPNVRIVARSWAARIVWERTVSRRRHNGTFRWRLCRSYLWYSCAVFGTTKRTYYGFGTVINGYVNQYPYHIRNKKGMYQQVFTC